LVVGQIHAWGKQVIPRLRFRKMSSGFVVWVTVAAVVFGQEAATPETPPSAKIERGQVLVNPKGTPQRVNLEFGITAQFRVAEARLFYKTSGATEFDQTRLRKVRETLRYGASVPSNTLQYFIELKPEWGSSKQIGSSESPFLLDTSTFERVTETKKLTPKQAVLVGATMVIGLLGYLIGVGAANLGKKKRH